MRLWMRLDGLPEGDPKAVEGADADLVVFDPEAKIIVHASEMHSRADYDPFEGFEVTGWPRTTIARGELIVNARKPAAQAGRGRFLPRAAFSPAWQRT